MGQTRSTESDPPWTLSFADNIVCNLAALSADLHRSQGQSEPRQGEREPRRSCIYPFGKELSPPSGRDRCTPSWITA